MLFHFDHLYRDRLWTNVITAKYMNGTSILQVQKKPGSYIWNSIMKSRDILKSGYEFRVGNGDSSFWNSSWTCFGPLAKLVPYVVDIHDIHLCISDVYNNGDWNLEILYTSLPQHVREYIYQLVLTLNGAVQDALIWKGNISRI